MSNLFKKYWPLLILPIGFILDLITKQLALNIDDTIVIIPNFFSLELVFNKGAAWGILFPKWFLISINLVAGVGFITYFFKTKGTKLSKVGCVLIATGAFGNLIDRAFYEYGVIDFIAFDFFGYQFPRFNFADSFIVIGVIIFLVALFIEERKNGVHN
ncbi:MAG: signal peptidase II [Bacilli bacterium]|nr:signal peptidase II [Bacilli bacterium]